MVVSSDLRHLFGPARDQGERPTCLTFAASDTHAGLRPGWIPLSCEHAFYHSVQRINGDPNNGITLPAILETLREDGQPVESDWPYLRKLPSDLNLWKPPPMQGPLFRRAYTVWPSDFGNVIQSLDRGIPVVIGMCLSDAFYKPGTNGIIAAQEPIDRHRRHAVIGVGHGQQGQDRFVLVRNSWGTMWGIGGYAWVSQYYLEPRLMKVVELKEDLT